MKLSFSLVILSTLVAAIMTAPSASPESGKGGMVEGVDAAADAVSTNCNNGADTFKAFTNKFPIPGADMIKTGIDVANTACTVAQVAGQAVLVEGAKKIDEISGVNADKEESEDSE